MDLLAIGGDLRYRYMIDGARQRGLDAQWIETVDARARDADRIVLPGPDIPDDLRAGTRLLMMRAPKGGVRGAFDIVDLSQDETLARKNAALTAEGALHAVMSVARFALWRCDCMVIGYGRIGRALHVRLSGMGARVTVAARREKARGEASSMGAHAINMSELPEEIRAQRVVFSTPPERVLSARDVSGAHRDALVVDLSSAPYGVDVDGARLAGVNAWREPALPGRYCPESAGMALLDAVLEDMRGDAVL